MQLAVVRFTGIEDYSMIQIEGELLIGALIISSLNQFGFTIDLQGPVDIFDVCPNRI